MKTGVVNLLHRPLLSSPARSRIECRALCVPIMAAPCIPLPTPPSPGKDKEEMQPTLQYLAKHGIAAILDYAAEDDLEASEQDDLAGEKGECGCPGWGHWMGLGSLIQWWCCGGGEGTGRK